MSYPIVECRSCRHGVIWAWTEKMTRMPVNAAPQPDGNLLLRKEDGLIRCQSVSLADLPVEADRYISHFATCKQAKSWRR